MDFFFLPSLIKKVKQFLRRGRVNESSEVYTNHFKKYSTFYSNQIRKSYKNMFHAIS